MRTEWTPNIDSLKCMKTLDFICNIHLSKHQEFIKDTSKVTLYIGQCIIFHVKEEKKLLLLSSLFSENWKSTFIYIISIANILLIFGGQDQYEGQIHFSQDASLSLPFISNK